jgi:CheY-like chemotaxis protein
MEWGDPDVVLLDINLQGISGIEAVPMLRLRWPGCRIVFVTSEQDQAVLARAGQRRRGHGRQIQIARTTCLGPAAAGAWDPA